MSGPHAAPITPESLARERCAEIRAETPPLTTDEAGSLAAGVAGEWQIDEGKIRREFNLQDVQRGLRACHADRPAGRGAGPPP